MKKIILIALLFSSSYSLAQEQALADDGRRVILNTDGSWEYASDDKFATKANGERIILKADGQWQISKEAPIATRLTTQVSPKVNFAKGYMMYQKKKSGPKNMKIRSQSVFFLDSNSSTALSKDDITVFDNKQNDYAIIELSTATHQDPNKKRWVLKVDGAPKWKASFGINHISVKIAGKALQQASDLVIKTHVDELDTKVVDNLF